MNEQGKLRQEDELNAIMTLITSDSFMREIELSEKIREKLFAQIREYEDQKNT